MAEVIYPDGHKRVTWPRYRSNFTYEEIKSILKDSVWTSFTMHDGFIELMGENSRTRLIVSYVELNGE